MRSQKNPLFPDHAWASVALVVALIACGCGDAGAEDPATEAEIQEVAQVIDDAPQVNAMPAPAGGDADWKNLRGPEYDGSTDEADWKPWNGQPTIAWKKDIGTGAASIVFADGVAYTIGNKDDRDIVYAFDAKTGAQKWTFDYACDLGRRQFEGGPGSTPTYADGRLFVVSHEGHVHALNAADGKLLWKKHLVKDFNGKRVRWGYSQSPLVIDDMVILEPGGRGTSTVALDVKTGDVKWKSGSDRAGYAAPVPMTHQGKTLIVTMKAEHAVVLDTQGKEIWRHKWETSYDVNASSPIIIGDLIFVSSGYGTGCALLKLGQNKPIWRNKNLAPQVSQPAYHDGYIYGFDGQVGRRAQLVAIDLKTGDTEWSQRGMGAGTLLIADEKLIVLSERGELIIANATPRKFDLISRGQVLRGRCWVTPAIDDGRILARSNDGDLVAVDVSK